MVTRGLCHKCILGDCTLAFASEAELKEHTKSHPIVVSTGRRAVPSAYLTDRSSQSVVSSPPSVVPRLFSCHYPDECELIFSTESELSEHLSRCHPLPSPPVPIWAPPEPVDPLL